MIPSMTEDEVRQNLIDAGCDPQMIQRYMAAMAAGDLQTCSRHLEQRRQALLDEIHHGEKRLYCLDYLRYQLRKVLDART